MPCTNNTGTLRVYLGIRGEGHRNRQRGNSAIEREDLSRHTSSANGIPENSFSFLLYSAKTRSSCTLLINLSLLRYGN